MGLITWGTSCRSFGTSSIFAGGGLGTPLPADASHGISEKGSNHQKTVILHNSGFFPSHKDSCVHCQRRLVLTQAVCEPASGWTEWWMGLLLWIANSFLGVGWWLGFEFLFEFSTALASALQGWAGTVPVLTLHLAQMTCQGDVSSPRKSQDLKLRMPSQCGPGEDALKGHNYNFIKLWSGREDECHSNAFNIGYILYYRMIMNLCFLCMLKFGYVWGRNLSLIFYLLDKELILILCLLIKGKLEKQATY